MKKYIVKDNVYGCYWMGDDWTILINCAERYITLKDARLARRTAKKISAIKLKDMEIQQVKD